MISQNEKSAIQKFKIAAKQFWETFVKLASYKDFVKTQNPKLQQEYAEVMKEGASLRFAVEKITKSIDTVAGIYKEIRDFFVDDKPDTLEAIPALVAVGGAIGITAMSLTIANWVRKAKLIDKRLAEMQRLEQQGVSSQEAYKITTGLIPLQNSSLLNLGFSKKILPWILIAGAFYLIPKFLEK